MENIVKYFTEKQKTLFIVDGLGAFITAFALFIVAHKFKAYFGMPKNELTFLSAIAFCFCIYSAVCFLFLKRGFKPFIKIIGFSNLLYCSFTTVLLVKHYPLLTRIGLTYFLVEIVIICGLSYVELNVGMQKNKL